ncbi:hypothetical protein [Marinoscillum sp. 108]|uniref:hypothetical protein n=1 Tax=Marinoscillum sp. 108 TaxID=2653151 RepID=UPI0012F37CC7|nr:hypothetical protein [Marinoscillum sp. 108]VXD14765.1 hypothetical protein MARINOS108_12104 [Marinoscillum sp. 108]
MKKPLIAFIWFLACACTPPPSQQPLENFGPFTGATVSCGHLQIFVLNQSGTGYLRVFVDDRALPLGRENTFRVGEDGLSVEYRAFDQDISSMLCNDVMPSVKPRELQRVPATTGVVYITLSQEDLDLYLKGVTYRVNVVLNDVSIDGLAEPLSFRLEGMVVGWLPG